ncbi:MAG TPA: hypothetical protein VLU43_18100 [Anaeromyxobacteraceae bacterium]|nr:hypothetical protein [Anaeromyxobacteraceae bacterium]
MLKAIAVVRTLFLVFVVGSAVRAMPYWTTVARTFDEQYARCSDSLSLLIRAVWLAIGWIAVETVAGWWIAVRRGSKARLSDSDVRPPPSA